MSDKIDNMINGVEDFRANMGSYIVEVLVDRSDEILQQVKNQLFEGIGGDGQPLSPGYLDDPYYDTLEQRQRYMRWKAWISPEGRGIPLQGVNLYINGTFHNSLYADVDVESSSLKITSPREIDIMAKWGVQKFAPTDEWMNLELREHVLDKLLSKLRELL